MNFPEDLKYTKEHEWIRINGNEAYVGITEFAQSELGDIVFIDVETVGSSPAAGAVFGTIEAVKTVSDLFMPVSGTVVEKNALLEDKPELVNSDPYGDGWIIKISFADGADGLSALLSAADYQKETGH